MKLVIFTSNAIRHKFLANFVAGAASKVLIVSECKPSDYFNSGDNQDFPDFRQRHFAQRWETESRIFANNDCFYYPSLPILYKEANSDYVYQIVKRFQPDLGIVYGASLLKKNILSLLPKGRFWNLHLGLSPYCRGSGTNFWPFVNDELEYVGSTILLIDPGVDTGDIVAHIRPKIEKGDNVHTVGCKVIKSSAETLLVLMKMLKDGKKISSVRQWSVPGARYYRESDFTEEAYNKYLSNLRDGLVERYLKSPQKELRLVVL